MVPDSQNSLRQKRLCTLDLLSCDREMLKILNIIIAGVITSITIFMERGIINGHCWNFVFQVRHRLQDNGRSPIQRVRVGGGHGNGDVDGHIVRGNLDQDQADFETGGFGHPTVQRIGGCHDHIRSGSHGTVLGFGSMLHLGDVYRPTCWCL